jgi:hypothetical protein
MDEIQFASERELAIRNVDRESHTVFPMTGAVANKGDNDRAGIALDHQ